MEELQIFLPLVKGWTTAAGKMRIGGVASDETLDLDREITAINGLKDSLNYLKSWGKFNDNHTRTLIGEIDHAEILTKGQLLAKGFFAPGELAAEEHDKACLYVEGYLYPKIKEAKDYYDIIKSGGRIGMSLQGRILQRQVLKKGGEQVVVNSKCFVNQVAITGEPINPSTCARVLKSLKPASACANCISCSDSANCLKANISKSIAFERKMEERYIELRKGLSSEPIKLEKALTAGAGIVGEGEGGGDKLRTQSIEKERKSVVEAPDLRDPEDEETDEEKKKRLEKSVFSHIGLFGIKRDSLEGSLAFYKSLNNPDNLKRFGFDDVREAKLHLLKSIKAEPMPWDAGEGEPLAKSIESASALSHDELRLVEHIKGMSDEDMAALVDENMESLRPYFTEPTS